MLKAYAQTVSEQLGKCVPRVKRTQEGQGDGELEQEDGGGQDVVLAVSSISVNEHVYLGGKKSWK